MDRMLLDCIVCPACRGELTFHGKADLPRFRRGRFVCAACGLTFPLENEVPMLVPPGTSMDGARWEGKEAQVAEWVARNFARAQGQGVPAAARDFLEVVRDVPGLVLDIASGPGGSYCVPMMREAGPACRLVMSDLGAPVMHAWRRCLREAGWGERCSNLVFDARRMPFRDGVVAAITSVGGFGNIAANHQAYAEAARVLAPAGRLLDVARFYAEGGPTQQHLSRVGQAGATWSDYEALLAGLGFRIERGEILNAGHGKTCPGDGLPLGDEAWEHRVVLAIQVGA